MDKQVFLSWCPDWADEADFPGYVIVKESEWEEYKEIAKKHEGYVTWGFGTNEYNEYENMSEVIDEVAVMPITEGEAETLKKFMGVSFGSTLPEIAYEEDGKYKYFALERW